MSKKRSRPSGEKTISSETPPLLSSHRQVWRDNGAISQAAIENPRRQAVISYKEKILEEVKRKLEQHQAEYQQSRAPSEPPSTGVEPPLQGSLSGGTLPATYVANPLAASSFQSATPSQRGVAGQWLGSGSSGSASSGSSTRSTSPKHQRSSSTSSQFPTVKRNTPTQIATVPTTTQASPNPGAEKSRTNGPLVISQGSSNATAPTVASGTNVSAAQPNGVSTGPSTQIPQAGLGNPQVHHPNPTPARHFTELLGSPDDFFSTLGPYVSPATSPPTVPNQVPVRAESASCLPIVPASGPVPVAPINPPNPPEGMLRAISGGNLALPSTAMTSGQPPPPQQPLQMRLHPNLQATVSLPSPKLPPTIFSKPAHALQSRMPPVGPTPVVPPKRRTKVMTYKQGWEQLLGTCKDLYSTQTTGKAGHPMPPLRVPARRKTQRDFLLDEMEWMAQDFRAERRWQRSLASCVARSAVQKREELTSQKLDKEVEQATREVMAHLSKCKSPYNPVNKQVQRFDSSQGKIVSLKRSLSDGEVSQLTVTSSPEKRELSDDHVSDLVSEIEALVAKSKAFLEAIEERMLKKRQNQSTPPSQGQRVDETTSSTFENTEEKKADGNTSLGSDILGIEETALPLLSCELRPHQRVAVSWVQEMQKAGQGVVLADPSGSGQTVTSLCIIAGVAETRRHRQTLLRQEQIKAEAKPIELGSISTATSLQKSTTMDLEVLPEGDLQQESGAPKELQPIMTSSETDTLCVPSTLLDSEPSIIQPALSPSTSVPAAVQCNFNAIEDGPVLLLVPASQLLRWHAELSLKCHRFQVAMMEDWLAEASPLADVILCSHAGFLSACANKDDLAYNPDSNRLSNTSWGEVLLDLRGDLQAAMANSSTASPESHGHEKFNVNVKMEEGAEVLPVQVKIEPDEDCDETKAEVRPFWECILDLKSTNRLILTDPLQDDDLSLDEIKARVCFLLPQLFKSVDTVMQAELVYKSLLLSRTVEGMSLSPVRASQIIYCSMSRSQRMAYADLIHNEEVWQQLLNTSNSSPEIVAQAMMKLRSVCFGTVDSQVKIPQSMKEKWDEENRNLYPPRRRRKRKIGNAANSYIKSELVNEPAPEVNATKVQWVKRLELGSAKLRILTKLLKGLHAEGKKVLVLAGCPEVLDLIKDYLWEGGVPQTEMEVVPAGFEIQPKGKSQDASVWAASQAAIWRFNKSPRITTLLAGGPSPLLTSHRSKTECSKQSNENSKIPSDTALSETIEESTKELQLGLSPSAADAVVMLDEPWSPALRQWTERVCSRMIFSSNGTCNLYRLVTEETIEHSLWDERFSGNVHRMWGQDLGSIIFGPCADQDEEEKDKTMPQGNLGGTCCASELENAFQVSEVSAWEKTELRKEEISRAHHNLSVADEREKVSSQKESCLLYYTLPDIPITLDTEFRMGTQQLIQPCDPVLYCPPLPSDVMFQEVVWTPSWMESSVTEHNYLIGIRDVALKDRKPTQTKTKSYDKDFGMRRNDTEFDEDAKGSLVTHSFGSSLESSHEMATSDASPYGLRLQNYPGTGEGDQQIGLPSMPMAGARGVMSPAGGAGLSCAGAAALMKSEASVAGLTSQPYADGLRTNSKKQKVSVSSSVGSSYGSKGSFPMHQPQGLYSPGTGQLSGFSGSHTGSGPRPQLKLGLGAAAGWNRPNRGVIDMFGSNEWTLTDDGKLMGAVEAFGTHAWRVVAFYLNKNQQLIGWFRTMQACQERWEHISKQPPSKQPKSIPLQSAYDSKSLLLDAPFILKETWPGSRELARLESLGSPAFPVQAAQAHGRMTMAQRFSSLLNAVGRGPAVPGVPGCDDPNVPIAQPHHSHARANEDAGVKPSLGPVQIIEVQDRLAALNKGSLSTKDKTGSGTASSHHLHSRLGSASGSSVNSAGIGSMAGGSGASGSSSGMMGVTSPGGSGVSCTGPSGSPLNDGTLTEAQRLDLRFNKARAGARLKKIKLQPMATGPSHMGSGASSLPSSGMCGSLARPSLNPAGMGLGNNPQLSPFSNPKIPPNSQSTASMQQHGGMTAMPLGRTQQNPKAIPAGPPTQPSPGLKTLQPPRGPSFPMQNFPRGPLGPAPDPQRPRPPLTGPQTNLPIAQQKALPPPRPTSMPVVSNLSAQKLVMTSPQGATIPTRQGPQPLPRGGLGKPMPPHSAGQPPPSRNLQLQQQAGSLSAAPKTLSIAATGPKVGDIKALGAGLSQMPRPLDARKSTSQLASAALSLNSSSAASAAAQALTNASNTTNMPVAAADLLYVIEKMPDIKSKIQGVLQRSDLSETEKVEHIALLLNTPKVV